MLFDKKKFDKKIFAKSHPVPAGYEKYMGLGAVYIERNHNPSEVMAIKTDKNSFIAGLARDWDITDRKSAKENIEWLLTEGHRWRHNYAYMLFKNGDSRAIPPENAVNFEELQKVEKDYKLDLEDVANCRTILAWDLERAAYLARVCAHLGYITETEAFDYLINRIYPLVKKTFNDWSNYLISFLEGRAFCYGGKASEFSLYIPDLLNKVSSVWVKYPLHSMLDELERQAVQEKIKQVFAEFRAQTQLPSIRIKAYRGKAELTDSKFGGMPYFPIGMDFPRGENGQPLLLLAQLNFADIPPLEDFPAKGLLQFFIAPDSVYGCGYPDETIQKNFRIIFHEDLTLPALTEVPRPKLDDSEEYYFPFSEAFEGDIALKFEKGTEPLSPSDFRFNDTVMPIFRKHFDTQAKNFYDVKKELGYDKFKDNFDKLYDECMGHRIGGYAMFTQADLRKYGSEYEKYGMQNHTILLFQMDSENIANSLERDEILWGDDGVANFFITPEDLAKKDFSRVAYNWDCY